MMAVKAEEIGVRKAHMGGLMPFAWPVPAGAFIALGAIFATTVGAGSFVTALADGGNYLHGRAG